MGSRIATNIDAMLLVGGDETGWLIQNGWGAGKVGEASGQGRLRKALGERGAELEASKSLAGGSWRSPSCRETGGRTLNRCI